MTQEFPGDLRLTQNPDAVDMIQRSFSHPQQRIHPVIIQAYAVEKYLRERVTCFLVMIKQPLLQSQQLLYIDQFACKILLPETTGIHRFLININRH